MRKTHKCPCYNTLTDTAHDYREQVINDIPAFGKNCFIHLRREDTVVPAVNALLKIICFFLITTA